ncbi:MAG: hypothetical protein U0074_08425 [Kouleothrix sp.]
MHIWTAKTLVLLGNLGKKLIWLVRSVATSVSAISWLPRHYFQRCAAFSVAFTPRRRASVFTVQEEIGMRGAAQFDTSQLSARAKVTFDSGGELAALPSPHPRA